MVKLFDVQFLLGSALVLVALAVAILAVIRVDIPIVGAGTGALITVAVIGMAGCAVAGISQAPAVGWTAPTIVLGSVLGIAALLIVAAGLFGWSPVLEPIGRLVPAGLGQLSTAQVATFALGGVIAIKWVVGIGMAIANR